jgi:hypothetical protein
MLSPAWRACEVDALYPGLADSPWALCCRPLRGLVRLTRVPRARGLALGFMLSPAARACVAYVRHAAIHESMRRERGRSERL